MSPLIIALIALHVIGIADVWFSKLSTGAKILWSFNIASLLVVGVSAWIITRGSAYQEVGPAGYDA